MKSYDLHVHSNFSDGKNSPEEIVLAAIEKGMDIIGISDHSYTFFDEVYCVQRNRIEEYKTCIESLKEKYKEKIKVLCGVEQDFYSAEDTADYDYVIGSVHYIKSGDDYIPVDESPKILKKAIKTHFGGDVYSLVEAYYKTVSQLAEKTKADIIGHFDLISKFNENGELFDEAHPRYIAAYKAAADSLLKAKKPFEINTGAISRGYRTAPYPSAQIAEYIKVNGGSFVLSSDSHSKSTLQFYFDKIEI